MKKCAAVIFCFLTTSLFAIEGTYDLQGYDPYKKENYTGQGKITRDQNDVYQAEWTIAGKKYVGTGLKNNNEISFIFVSPEDSQDSGLQIYKIEDHKLSGPWVLLGKSIIGRETLIQKH